MSPADNDNVRWAIRSTSGNWLSDTRLLPGQLPVYGVWSNRRLFENRAAAFERLWNLRVSGATVYVVRVTRKAKGGGM